MMAFDIKPALDHSANHLTPQILVVIRRRHGEVTLLVAGTVTQVVSFPARVPAAFLSVYKVVTRMLILIEADVIEYEELRLRSKIRRVSNARILKVQLRLAGDPARVP